MKARSVYSRFNKALAAAEASCGVIVQSAGSQSGSARGGSDRSGNSRARDMGKPVVDLRTIQCFGCHQDFELKLDFLIISGFPFVLWMFHSSLPHCVGRRAW